MGKSCVIHITIVKLIVEQLGDYVITLQKNQGELYEWVE